MLGLYTCCTLGGGGCFLYTWRGWCCLYQGGPPGAILVSKTPFIGLLDLLDLLEFIRIIGIYWQLCVGKAGNGGSRAGQAPEARARAAFNVKCR